MAFTETTDHGSKVRDEDCRTGEGEQDHHQAGHLPGGARCSGPAAGLPTEEL